MSEKKVAKKRQFYKVINPQGHHGMKYHVGDNFDPNPRPLGAISSCGSGALYFCTKEYLPEFYSWGTKIAWVEPIGKYVKDSEGTKYKAHGLRITKMLPIADAILEIYPKEEWENMFLNFRERMPQKVLDMLPMDKIWQNLAKQSPEKRASFLRKHDGNKELFKIVMKKYNRGFSQWVFSDEVVAKWLLSQGADLMAIDGSTLRTLLLYNTSVRKIVAERFGENVVKLLRHVAG